MILKKNIINILKESEKNNLESDGTNLSVKHQKYIDYVVGDYIKNVKIYDDTISFSTAGQLRDIGWDDEMLDFGYNQYERIGFKQVGEDSYVFKNNLEYIWDTDEMLQEMFYHFIDEKVEFGGFRETDDGWEILQNEWKVKFRNGTTIQAYWSCGYKRYSILEYTDDIEEVTIDLYNLYGVPSFLEDYIINNIVKKIGIILNSRDKFCP